MPDCHVWCCPECDQKSKIKRVTNNFVEKWGFEADGLPVTSRLPK